MNIMKSAVGLTAWLLAAQTGWTFYNPQTGRWLDRDPIQEGGGNNLYGFLKNDPPAAVDLRGWIRIQFVRHDSETCNYDEVAWRYEIDRPEGAPCDGYMVQEVRIHTRQDLCCHEIPNAPVVPTTQFWEAMPVTLGGRTPGFEDTSGVGAGTVADAVGNYYVEAEVKFFCRAPTPGVSEVGTGVLEQTPFWITRIVTGGQTLQSLTQPPWWSSPPVEGPATRTRRLLWDCCPIVHAWSIWEASWSP